MEEGHEAQIAVDAMLEKYLSEAYKLVTEARCPVVFKRNLKENDDSALKENP